MHVSSEFEGKAKDYSILRLDMDPVNITNQWFVVFAVKGMIAKVMQTTEQVAASAQELTSNASNRRKCQIKCLLRWDRVAAGADRGRQAKDASGKMVRELVEDMNNVQTHVEAMAKFTDKAVNRTLSGKPSPAMRLRKCPITNK